MTCKSYRKTYDYCCDGFHQSYACWHDDYNTPPMCLRELEGPYETTCVVHPETGLPRRCDVRIELPQAPEVKP